MRTVSIGHLLFAATLIAMGIAGLVTRDFAPIWEPASTAVPARAALAFVCACIALASGAGLLWQRSAPVAARVLLTCLLLWLLLFKVPYIFFTPAVEVTYESAGETAVLVAAAGVLYAWFKGDRAGTTNRRNGVRMARALYALALIAFGLSHFAYTKETAGLVPGWLPSHTTWAYLTGCTYLAAGVAVLVGVYARLAATLSVFQMGMFTLIVWVPAVAAGGNASQWSELAVSWALTVGGWVVADSYRGVPWFAARRKPLSNLRSQNASSS